MAIALTTAALIATATPLTLAAPLPVHMQSADAVAAQPAPEEAPPASEAESEAQAPQQDVEEQDTPVDPNVIVVSGASDARKKDPLVQVNETAFAITQSVDAALVEPIADVYEDDIPSPIRKGLRNFFRNLLEPVTALNYFLQLKPGKAFETLGRFGLNSTIGVAGLFDVAKKEPFNLPYRRNGFANTLGYYGVEPGPFLVLPLVGATTLRDLIGGGIDQSFLPLAVGKPFGTPLYAVPAYTVNSLEFRIEFDQRLEDISNSDDPYFAMRETYLCQREADIAALKNRPPPRDCSIEAIMGLDEGTIEQLTQPAQDTSSVEAMAPEPEPAPPAIRYVSNPVIQPLPADYVQAPPPPLSN
ncbi:MlaA family lipoprotein [Altererythrobacter lutimaris]|uniref:VacJ family lipoprotein n=1 Tax=Altererythrobacter lutimaris TaxID=2743979 RepID=A0A850HEI6_9SPHN|nr:VacJ family lipoprotein [Altererythrobacter lutimaris]NVE95288.1 VacJ family lipoprotein [Altererythrobacter lutimaris]